jgi:hypothetical protein
MCRDESVAGAYWIRFGRSEDSPERKHACPAAAYLDVVRIIRLASAHISRWQHHWRTATYESEMADQAGVKDCI